MGNAQSGSCTCVVHLPSKAVGGRDGKLYPNWLSAGYGWLEVALSNGVATHGVEVAYGEDGVVP